MTKPLSPIKIRELQIDPPLLLAPMEGLTHSAFRQLVSGFGAAGLGWDVPLADLRTWVRGLRAPGSAASVQYDERNLPAVIEQDGWRVEYRDWFIDRDPPLPRKVFANRADARVRMAIESWSVDE